MSLTNEELNLAKELCEKLSNAPIYPEVAITIIGAARTLLPKLIEEIERLKMEKTIFETECLRLEKYEQEYYRLRTALEFYADEKNWKLRHVDFAHYETEASLDGGQRARDALNVT